MSVLLPMQSEAQIASRQGRKRTVPMLADSKGLAPVSALTAYDFTMARIIDQAGVDMILVGDSLGNVIQGEESTLPVTMEHMVYHTRIVCKGATQALVIADMPFGSFQVSTEETVRNALRLVKDGGAAAVKLEGAGDIVLNSVRVLVTEGIPVMGHVGLTPQSVHAMGGFRRQGKTSQDAERIRKEAKALEDAGAFAVVLECIPDELAAEITADLTHALTIGIGSGTQCDGQILVSYDLFGLLENSPGFAPRLAEGRSLFMDAASQYHQSVTAGSLPGKQAAGR